MNSDFLTLTYSDKIISFIGCVWWQRKRLIRSSEQSNYTSINTTRTYGLILVTRTLDSETWNAIKIDDGAKINVETFLMFQINDKKLLVIYCIHAKNDTPHAERLSTVPLAIKRLKLIKLTESPLDMFRQ